MTSSLKNYTLIVRAVFSASFACPLSFIRCVVSVVILIVAACSGTTENFQRKNMSIGPAASGAEVSNILFVVMCCVHD